MTMDILRSEDALTQTKENAVDPGERIELLEDRMQEIELLEQRVRELQAAVVAVIQRVGMETKWLRPSKRDWTRYD